MISWLLALGLAWGGEHPEVTAQIHGDVKAFFVASFPYESVLFPDASPTGVGMVDGRLKMEAEAGERRRAQIDPKPAGDQVGNS